MTKKKIELLKTKISDLVAQKPEKASQIITNWVNQPKIHPNKNEDNKTVSQKTNKKRVA